MGDAMPWGEEEPEEFSPDLYLTAQLRIRGFYRCTHCSSVTRLTANGASHDTVACKKFGEKIPKDAANRCPGPISTADQHAEIAASLT